MKKADRCPIHFLRTEADYFAALALVAPQGTLENRRGGELTSSCQPLLTQRLAGKRQAWAAGQSAFKSWLQLDDPDSELHPQQLLRIAQGFFGFGVFACLMERFAVCTQCFDFGHVGV